MLLSRRPLFRAALLGLCCAVGAAAAQDLTRTSSLPATSSNGEGQQMVDMVINPELIADAVIVFEPSQTYQLDGSAPQDRALEGVIERVVKGEARPYRLFHPANSFIMPIERGQRYVLVLKELEQTGAFYAIAIYPVLERRVEK